MITTCWIGPLPFGDGVGAGDGEGGLRFFAGAGFRFDAAFLIPAPVYPPIRWKTFQSGLMFTECVQLATERDQAASRIVELCRRSRGVPAP
jgi:hypothetical protein